MLDGKLLLTITGIILAVIAFSNMDSNPIVENWWGGTAFTTRAMPGAMVNGKEVAISGNYLNPNMLGSGKFVSTPAFQAVLAPRFSNTQYGASIRYNLPDRENMAVPCDPLTFGSMASENYAKPAEPYAKPVGAGGHGLPPSHSMNLKGSNVMYGGGGNGGNGVKPQIHISGPQNSENYSANCGTGQCSSGTASCGKGGYGLGHGISSEYEVPPGYTNGNKDDVYNSLPASKLIDGSDLPIGTMSSVSSSGDVDQFIAFNRIMPANTKSSSRLRAQGDFVRGDNPIIPNQSGWFSVYPDLSRDLSEGYLGTLAGAGGGGESHNQLMNLIMNASGGTQSTLSGINYSSPEAKVNMATSMRSSVSAAMGDVNVSAFP